MVHTLILQIYSIIFVETLKKKTTNVVIVLHQKDITVTTSAQQLHW